MNDQKITTGSSSGMADLIKMQLFMGTGKDGETYSKLKSFMMLTLFDVLIGIAKQMFANISEVVKKWYNDKVKSSIKSKIDKSMGTGKVEHEITFERLYDSKPSKNSGNANERTDAILFFVAKLPEAKKMIYTDGIHVVNNGIEFEISKHVQFKLLNLEFNTDKTLGHIKFKLYSTVLDVCKLRQYVDGLLRDFLIDKQNRLGTDLYFFDHHIPPKIKTFSMMANGGKEEIDNTINDPVSFTKNLFITNRTLDNVFFEQRKDVRNRLQFFMNRKDWYDEKGVPYTLGFMFHGSPGTGKTSCIKAIANVTDRHVININMGKIKSKVQLKRLFYDERIEVLERSELGASNKQSYIIPIEKRLYVIEDIDCLGGDLLKKRNENDGETHEEQSESRSEPKTLSEIQNKVHNTFGDDGGVSVMDSSTSMMGNAGFASAFASLSPNESVQGEGTSSSTSIKETRESTEKKEDDSDLDLSTVLNVMDGTLETPGRMIVITSNYPEKLDHAFIRPGRIDMIVEFKKANRQIITEMFLSFYDIKPDPQKVEVIDEYKWTPAEVSQIMFKHFHDPEQSLIDLAQGDPKEYFKFSYFNRDEIND